MIHLNKNLFLPFLLLIIWNCDDQYNKGNEIISITSSVSEIKGGRTVQLACEATDEDGDKLTYFWESASGSLDQNGDSATWTAPADTGVYFITCTVSDDYGASAVGSIAIRVHPPSLVPVSGLDWTLTDDGLINGPNCCFFSLRIPRSLDKRDENNFLSFCFKPSFVINYPPHNRLRSKIKHTLTYNLAISRIRCYNFPFLSFLIY